jgi:hypothetical protein
VTGRKAREERRKRRLTAAMTLSTTCWRQQATVMQEWRRMHHVQLVARGRQAMTPLR